MDMHVACMHAAGRSGIHRQVRGWHGTSQKPMIESRQPHCVNYGDFYPAKNNSLHLPQDIQPTSTI